ncbi:MAG: hypothetical protein EAZ85_13560 [Bacteroidetes bacterium]|nr:MAG: hypothetical protein EAZ85_13560 [Bacteroidota bacterium]TAG86558.1 MAG: hypothetical protein EAZ20_12515 [Bacteroidota bacterium]
MTTNNEQEKERLIRFFKEIRQILFTYLEDRNLVLTNSQLFGFVLISPVTLAITSDGNVDLAETTMLVDVASYFERGILKTDFDALPQPDNHISDKEFKKIIYSELRHLCFNIKGYENMLIESLKRLLVLDEELDPEANMRYAVKFRVKEMMNSVIYNNLGVDSLEEARLREIWKQLGWKDIN